ncbi:hypothetical protein BKA63DRAFT_402981 [Paraphoma chrysanthemicola]|nr:hypothetical protein BKA63DRAFT_402981 [Paraphoma chrysanthemicola]
MSSAAVGSFWLPHPATLCPPTLHIQKRSRRTTFRRRMLRKSTNANRYPPHGPLDDIIDVIKSNIWDSPPGHGLDTSFLNWVEPLKTTSTWTVTPLPLSRAPKDQPLTIRKNRNSRSSTSGSSTGDAMCGLRNNSQDEATSHDSVGAPSSSDTTPWPVFDDTPSYEPANGMGPASNNNGIEHVTPQQSRDEGRVQAAKQRRPSRLRLFTNRFPRLRRTATGDTSASTADASESGSPTTTALQTSLDDSNHNGQAEEPNDEAVEAYIRRTANNCSRLRAMMERMAERLPSPVDVDHEPQERQLNEATDVPTTLRAEIRIFPQFKELREDQQKIDVAVEVEGVLHNRQTLATPTIDVIFVVDNGYYVTKDCLERATDAVNGALHHLQRGDRLALFTTHCTHKTVTGNKPEMHYPFRPFSTDSEETLYALTGSIRQCGTQTWDPARPNPSMTDVVHCVARSLEDLEPKKGRSHVILLSPAAYVLHSVSQTFPDLYIHRINPATLPFRREPEMQDTVCSESCCKNVFVSNWSSYQSVPGRIKRILKNARSRVPVGDITDVSIDIRTKESCELLESYGQTDIARLRLGQIHTIICSICVDRNKTQGVDLESINPLFNSSLDKKGLRHDLRIAVSLGAIKVHLLDVQLLHRSSINRADCWTYNEVPLIVVRELGGLASPIDGALEVHRRQYFHKLVQLTTNQAKVEAQSLLAGLDLDSAAARKVLGRMAEELRCQAEARNYEREFRQNLPLCPGPIGLEDSHEWLQQIWNKRKTKRNGVAGVDTDVSGLINGMHGMSRLT